MRNPEKSPVPAPSGSLLRPADVATRCAVSLRTVRCWIASGRLRVIRFGTRCVRVHPDDLQRFLGDAANGGRP